MVKRLIILVITIFNLTFTCSTEMTVAPTPCAEKAYTRYQVVTNRQSNQWKLIQTLTVCDDGYLRDKDGFVAAALGSYFGDIGSRWLFVCEEGNIIPIIKVDEKQDIHTDWQTHTKGIISGKYVNGEIVRTGEYIEFYIDVGKMSDLVYENLNPCVNNTPNMDGNIIGWIEINT